MTEEHEEIVEDMADNEALEAEAPVTDSQDPEPAPPEWSDDDAEQAKAFGWKPPDEWKGEKPSGYIDDPRRYLERAESFKPFQKLKEQSERDRERDRELFDERLRKMEAINENVIKSQKERYEAERAEIEASQRKAVELADVDEYDALERRKANLQPAPVVPAESQQPQPDPEVEKYRQENTWMSNPVLFKAGHDILNANPQILNKAPIEQVRFAESEVRKLYPGAFETSAPTPQPKPAPRQRVDSGGLGSGGGADPLAKLPSEARAAFKKFKEQGLFKDTPEDRKRYADDYNAA